MYVIEDNIPVPEPGHTGGLKGFVKRLSVGQSFVLPSAKAAAAYAAGTLIRREDIPGFRLKMRKVDEHNHRIWRIA